jgi:AmiR/NasT family two-component response regulator
MLFTSSYILLLARQSNQIHPLATLLGRSAYSVAIANSEEQAVARTEQHPPFLIILAGDHLHWSHTLLQRLRAYANAHRITLLALTDFHAPSWIYQEENPGFDGFLVNPISNDILSSLVQSAYTRQACYSLN